MTGPAGSSARGCAVVLGATSPIAEAVCAQAAEAGYDVFVAARRIGDAEAIAADVGIRTGVRTGAGVFDALDLEGHPRFFEEVERSLGPVALVVVTFGDMGDQELAERDFTVARRVIDVNFTGAASACEAAVTPLLAAVGRVETAPTLVGVSSVAGDRGRQSNYVYGAAKGGFTLYLQGLRNRLFRSGVHVLTVKPGFVDTRMTWGMETALPIASPESVARAILRAVERGRNVLYVPSFWRWILLVVRMIPEFLFKRLSM